MLIFSSSCSLHTGWLSFCRGRLRWTRAIGQGGPSPRPILARCTGGHHTHMAAPSGSGCFKHLLFTFREPKITDANDIKQTYFPNPKLKLHVPGLGLSWYRVHREGPRSPVRPEDATAREEETEKVNGFTQGGPAAQAGEARTPLF